MFAVVVLNTDIDHGIDEVFVSNTKDEAIDIARKVIICWFTEDIELWDKGELMTVSERSILSCLKADLELAKTNTWEECERMMELGIIMPIRIVEVSVA